MGISHPNSDTLSEQRFGGTKFPKISGKPNDFLRNLTHLRREGKLPETLMLEGTVKLHGMHTDLVFDLRTCNTAVKYQSRNRECHFYDDQLGWPIKISKFEKELNTLKDAILTRYKRRNPAQPLDKSKPLIVAGEWIGRKVQRYVGTSELSRRFVVLTISINGKWQNDYDYGDIECPEALVYNIHRVPQYLVSLDTRDMTVKNPALFELQKLADQVEKACPFAATFGIEKGMGEGIVWKPAIPECRGDAKYWLKTKGPYYRSEDRIKPYIHDPRVNIGVTKWTASQIQRAAREWVTQRRIGRAYQYIEQMGLTDKNPGREFCKWIIDDVLKEEETDIEDMIRCVTDAESVVLRTLAEASVKAFRETEDFGLIKLI